MPSGGRGGKGGGGEAPAIIIKIKKTPAGQPLLIFISRLAPPPPNCAKAPRRHPLLLTGYWEGTAAAGSAWGEDNCIGGNV